jgi:DNA ligase D-like protein (predicted ligase)
MPDVRKQVAAEYRGRLKKKSFPGWISPMLATLTDDYFSDENWIYERKLDGERCLLFYRNGGATLMSRNRKKLNDTYPDLEEAVAGRYGRDFIADGEIVAFSGKRTSFSRLQERMQIRDHKEAAQSSVAVYYYLFDLLYLDGCDICGLPLRQRKKLLRSLLDWQDPLRFTPHRNREGEKYHRQACGKGWEGIIAKDAASRYVHSRSTKWLKFKCVNRQEFVIGGFTDPKGERVGFGALLLGYYEGKKLRYAGMVGTGFSDDFLADFRERLDRIERRTPAFAKEEVLPARGVHWVRPQFVGQVGFTEWTEDLRLRHPRFLGLRRDKEPGDVVREKG